MSDDQKDFPWLDDAYLREYASCLLRYDCAVWGMARLAEFAGLGPGSLWTRLHTAGWPGLIAGAKRRTSKLDVVPEELLAPTTRRVGGVIISGRYYRTHYEIKRNFGYSEGTIREKLKIIGKREFTVDELINAKTKSTYKPKLKPQEEHKLSTDQGNWGSLSSRKNTGAGRGEIPNDEWIGMIGGRLKSISSGNHGVSLAAFNR